MKEIINYCYECGEYPSKDNNPNYMCNQCYKKLHEYHKKYVVKNEKNML